MLEEGIHRSTTCEQISAHTEVQGTERRCSIWSSVDTKRISNVFLARSDGIHCALLHSTGRNFSESFGVSSYTASGELRCRIWQISSLVCALQEGTLGGLNSVFRIELCSNCCIVYDQDLYVAFVQVLSFVFSPQFSKFLDCFSLFSLSFIVLAFLLCPFTCFCQWLALILLV